MANTTPLGAALGWFRDAFRRSGREREGLTQAVKMTFAAAVAWTVGRWLDPAQAFLAPYTAVFMISESLARSVRSAVEQLLAIVIGVLLGYVVVGPMPHLTVAIVAAVFVGLLLGQWHRFEDNGVWIGITALLVITLGAADEPMDLVVRVIQCALGAAIGVAINVVVLPPLHIRETDQSVQQLGGEIADLLDDLADGLREPWTTGQARTWLSHALTLEQTSDRAEHSVQRAHDGVRFNPRWMLRPSHHRGPEPRRYELAVTALHEVTRQAQRIGESLAWLDAPDHAHAVIDSTFKESFGDLLDAFADIVRTYADFTQDPEELNRRLDELVEEVRHEHGWLDARIREGDTDALEAWSAHGALLLALYRAVRALTDALSD